MKVYTKIFMVSSTLLLTLLLNTSVSADTEKDTSTKSQSELYDDVNQKMTQVYLSRDNSSISDLESEINELDTEYKTPVKASFEKLKNFLHEINTVDLSVENAEKTKSAESISDAQTKIKILDEQYQSNDKKQYQKQIDAVVNHVNAEKEAKEAAEAKAKQEAADLAEKQRQEAIAAEEAKAAAEQAQKEAEAAKQAEAQAAETQSTTSTQAQTSNNPYGLKFTGYSSIDEARALRNMIEQGGNMNVNLSLSYNYIGGYGFARSTWIALSNQTGTSTTDFSVSHQNLLADTLVRDYFGGDWGNVPRSGGW